MKTRQGLLLVACALAAGLLGLVASVAINGPGALLRSELGQRLAERWLVPATPAGLRVAEPGELVTPIRLPDLQGRLRTVPTPGRAVLINYWASWCEPCREEMPLLAEFAESGAATEVVGIGLDTLEPARDFLAARPVPFPVLLETPSERDSSVQLGNRRGVLPFSVLIDAEGRLVKRRFGAFTSAADLRDWARTEH